MYGWPLNNVIVNLTGTSESIPHRPRVYKIKVLEYDTENLERKYEWLN